jgi:aspartate/methionine/tyrosine aminotransferase
MEVVETPISAEVVRKKIEECGITDFSKASIRDFVRLIALIEAETGERFVRMEMGVPGLPAAQIGVEAEIEALKKGVASIYPPIDGIHILKEEASKFIKNFIDIDISPLYCTPTVGSMQACYATLMVTCRRDKKRDTLLFLDPGFPVQKQQMQVMGLQYESFDVYDYRGEKLREKLESFLSKGNISSILYSNPNNPSWICFTEKELKIIGELANKYDVLIIEDLAYFGMDFRQDLSKPGVPPYQASVAKYTDQYVLLISSSKVFSYAGQRIAILAVSDGLASRRFPDLKRFFPSDSFGHAIVYGALYALSSGTSHSAQYALAALLKAVNEGRYNFIEDVKEYGKRAAEMKKIFLQYGFHLVYDKDEDKPLADGFYFTISYPGFSGPELVEKMIYYGISAIPLQTTGSLRDEGVRACVSFVRSEQMSDLESRLRIFQKHHPLA